MDLILFAVLGGSIGWLSGTICSGDERPTSTADMLIGTNILAGVGGALITEWLLVPFLGQSAQKDFTVSASVISLGAIVPSAGIALLRKLRQAPKSMPGRK